MVVLVARKISFPDRDDLPGRFKQLDVSASDPHPISSSHEHPIALAALWKRIGTKSTNVTL